MSRTSGRPLMLTPKLREKIAEAIRKGNFAEVAAVGNGVGRTTYYRWMQLGQEHECDAGSPCTRAEHVYREFRDDIERARAKAEMELVNVIERAAKSGTWVAAARLLESTAPGRWLRSEKRIPAAAGPSEADGIRHVPLRPGEPISFRIVVIPDDRDPADRAKVLDIPGAITETRLPAALPPGPALPPELLGWPPNGNESDTN